MEAKVGDFLVPEEDEEEILSTDQLKLVQTEDPDGPTVYQAGEGKSAQFFMVVEDGPGTSSGSRKTLQRVELVEVTEGEEFQPSDASPDQKEMKVGDNLPVGATTETGEDGMPLGEPMPQGMKMRRNRVFGTCRCPECGQSFINTARLERHLAVHQVFGSYLCPLCGKTYKYEYNLFYHWRKTCRDLNELLTVEERKQLDVGALKQLVDEVAAKKAELGHEPPLPPEQREPQELPPPRLDDDLPVGRRGEACLECGVVVLASHLQKHMAIHRGEVAVDSRGVSGGFYCDLCGLMFRQHFNLIKHWRTSCPEIQLQINPESDLTMDDESLKRMVEDLLQKKQMEAEARPAPKPPTNIVRRGKRERKRRRRDEVGDPEEVDVTTVEERQQHQQQDEVQLPEWMREDLVDREDEERFLEEMGQSSEPGEVGPLGLPTSNSRPKWSMVGGPVQCPECFRSFANSGRLERHLAGFHSSYGTHHCILCGNRFKYDYNLLYHYRRSCPYTKAYLDRDVREQMDAPSLRKLVRNLSQKEVRLNLQIEPPAKFVRRHQQQSVGRRHSDNKATDQPQLLCLRPGLPKGQPCPVCQIIFYGDDNLSRHMRALHKIDLAKPLPTDDETEDQFLEGIEEALEEDLEEEIPTAQAHLALEEEPDSEFQVESGEATVEPLEVEYREESLSQRSQRLAFTVPTCSDCGKVFITNAHLMRHIKQAHGAEAEQADGLPECSLCQLRFREDYNLIGHWRSLRCQKLKTAMKGKEKSVQGMKAEQLRALVDQLAGQKPIGLIADDVD